MKIAIFQFYLFGINTYVVYDPSTSCCAVVDPGMLGPKEEKAMDDFIARNNLKLTNIINTHLHLDHAVGNAYLKENYNVPVLASKADEPIGERMQQQAQMFGINEKFKGVEITEYLNDGDIITIGSGSLKVIAVPGHSQGSIALYDEADGFLIAGDALFKGSIGRTDLPGGNHQQLLDSIKSRLLSLPGNTVVYPGHGPATTIAEEKASNPFLR
ncbi:MAG: MBL fold metallo-hydrolase [Bacteroides sp.]|nr:MBL fold metallo-hydrolase [Bacteroides sp.]